LTRVRHLTLLVFLATLLMALFVPGGAGADEPAATPPHRTLKVGTVESEPWIMYDESVPEATRKPEGMSADLWAEISRRLNVDTQWVYYDSLPKLLDAVKDKQVDLGIAAVTITLEREKYLDFSNSMYESGLRILTRNEHTGTASTVKSVLKGLFWNANSLAILVVLFVVAHLLWILNRRRKGDFVPLHYKDGIRESLRWAFMGLIGASGGGSPKKGAPWVLGLIWQFTSKMLFIVLTGVFSAALALSAIENNINTISDLRGKRTAVVAGNAPEAFMQGLSATTLVPVKSLKEGVDLLVGGKVDAVVHDAPRLKYWRFKTNQREGKELLRVTAEDFDAQNYGIIFPMGSRLRKEINMELLNLREAKPGERSFYDQLTAKWIPR
jgi:polar amino acid transport system substrate-binding protein